MTKKEINDIKVILMEYPSLLESFKSAFEYDIKLDNTIYVYCLKRTVLWDNNIIHYVPIICISKNLTCCKILASEDLVALQTENNDLIERLYDDGYDAVLVPLPINVYSDLLAKVQESVNIISEAYRKSYDTYVKTTKIIGTDPSDDDFKDEFLNAIISEGTLPVVINSKLELVPSEEYVTPMDSCQSEEDFDDEEYEDMLL